MPSPTREFVEKNHTTIGSATTAVGRMNKAKAYRELQRRQGRLSKVWSEASSVTQSYDSTILKHSYSRLIENNNTNAINQNSTRPVGNKITNGVSNGAGKVTNSAAITANIYRNGFKSAITTDRKQNSTMVETATGKGELFTKRRFGSAMFTVNRSILVGDRPLTRERAASSRSRHLYTEPGRPVTAPETNAYATLDGARQEVMAVPHYTKANSVRSNGSETESLTGINSRRFSSQRKPRHSLDITNSIDCNNNDPLKPHNQSDQAGDSIQWPAASKMREMLANDGQVVTTAKPLMTEHGNRSIIRKASQVSFVSKTSSNSNTAPAVQAAPTTAVHKPAPVAQNNQPTGNKAAPVVKRPTQLPTPSSLICRRNSQTKQVSFSDTEPKPSVVSDHFEDKILALTTKNLNMYNAMVLKTLRTQKFDERIVQWVKERQCDNRSRIPRHDAIPEVDESSYSRESPHGRLTPNKRDHRGSTTPTDNDKLATPLTEQSQNGVPNSIKSKNANFSYQHEECDKTKKADSRDSPTDPKPSKETKLTVENNLSKPLKGCQSDSIPS